MSPERLSGSERRATSRVSRLTSGLSAPRHADTPLPDLAVALITYNHAAFIAESIQSIFGQRYAGRIHVIVSDDCSNDGTQKVITAMAADAPSNITLLPILRTVNVGGFHNLAGAWEAANETGSAYIALLEGDDYWTEPSKLACQVRYLEDHAAATMSFGLAQELFLDRHNQPAGKVVVVPPSDHPRFNELLGSNFVPTCTVVYRSGVLPKFPRWFEECPFRDWPMHLAHAVAGDMHFIGRVLAVHRQHPGSKWSNTTISRRERVQAIDRVQRLAMANLAKQPAASWSYFAAMRHLRWRIAGRNGFERAFHLFVALVLRPRIIVTAWRVLRRRRAANRDSRVRRPATSVQIDYPAQ